MRDVDRIIQLVRDVASEFQVQIESPDGMCPFLVETDENNDHLTGRSVEETVILTRLLHTKFGVTVRREWPDSSGCSSRKGTGSLL
jgi:hypothetical protein